MNTPAKIDLFADDVPVLTPVDSTGPSGLDMAAMKAEAHDFAQTLEAVRAEIGMLIVGQGRVVEEAMTALFCGGRREPVEAEAGEVERDEGRANLPVLRGVGLLLEFLGALLPEFGQFANLVRVLSGEVVLLGMIGLQVIQLPGRALGGDEFPVAEAERAVAFVSPPEFADGAVDVLAELEGDSGTRWNVTRWLRSGHARQSGERRPQVNHMPRLMP